MRVLNLDVRDGFVVPRISCIPLHASVVLELRDETFADIAAYWGMSDVIFRRKFVLPGDRWQAVLDRPGLVTLESEVRPLVHGYIYVTPTPVASVAGADGRYALEGVPAGRRRFTAWHEKQKILDFDVDVPAGGATRDIAFPSR